jgi:thiol:disulfide interchange protein DsbD
VLRLAVGVLLLVSGVAFALPRKEAPGVEWQKYDAQKIAAAQAAGKPVVIDFAADWCLPCKELDHKTFTDEKVIAELDRFVRIKADLTMANDARNVALAKQYAIVGMPTIVFIDSNGTEVSPTRLVGFEPPEKFLQRAKQVK